MRGYLLDTNVLSELLRKKPAEQVILRLRAIHPDLLLTSSVCVSELRYGAARHPQGDSLWARISQEVLPRIRVLPFGTREAESAGDLLARLERRGKVMDLEDVMIGSTALVHGLTAVTRNVRHFERIDGLAIENWWD